MKNIIPFNLLISILIINGFFNVIKIQNLKSTYNKLEMILDNTNSLSYEGEFNFKISDYSIASFKIGKDNFQPWQKEIWSVDKYFSFVQLFSLEIYGQVYFQKTIGNMAQTPPQKIKINKNSILILF